MKNLNDSGMSSLIAKRLSEDIDNYCKTKYDSGPRWHLGASLIGNECSRYLWYVFRWALHYKFDGRMQRLFNRGHKEENRFLEWLDGIGCKVEEVDKNTNSQFKISGACGHFGGSLDGKGFLPEQYGIENELLFEFKTNGTGAAFNKLASCKMAIAKPLHYAQTCTYGYKQNLTHCAYLNINKNDDSIYIEIVKLDHNIGKQMELKAEQIIFSQKPPEKISLNPTYIACKYCSMKDICHFNKIPEKNCRSCSFAKPIENAEWFCNAHNNTIPREFVPEGCGHWKPITEN